MSVSTVISSHTSMSLHSLTWCVKSMEETLRNLTKKENSLSAFSSSVDWKWSAFDGSVGGLEDIADNHGCSYVATIWFHEWQSEHANLLHSLEVQQRGPLHRLQNPRNIKRQCSRCCGKENIFLLVNLGYEEAVGVLKVILVVHLQCILQSPSILARSSWVPKLDMAYGSGP